MSGLDIERLKIKNQKFFCDGMSGKRLFEWCTQKGEKGQNHGIEDMCGVLWVKMKIGTFWCFFDDHEFEVRVLTTFPLF